MEQEKRLYEEMPADFQEFDELTGLYSQEAFYLYLPRLFQQEKQGNYYVLYIDIERFKLLNDLYGLEEGNKLLCWIGRYLKEGSGLRGGIGCRFRADNFAACASFEEEELRRVLWMIRDATRKYPLDFEIVLNIGIYRVDDITVPPRLMCDRARIALNTIKGNALDYYALYNNTMREDLIREQEMVRDMRIALEQKQFEIYAQPKFNHANGHLIGMEALIRWHHPEKGIISPAYFIPVFEHNNFIQEVDRYVWEAVCKRLYEWKNLGRRVIPISVNVSRINLYNPYLCEILEMLCERYQVDKKLLQLEITESAFIEDTQMIVDAVKRLQRAGFEILLDDFGSGFSSFHILKELDFDQIKVDMKFLMGNYSHGKGKVILESIVRMANTLEIPVIAEGVETKEQADFLFRIGCPYIQGYYYSKPIPRPELESLLLRYLDENKVQFSLKAFEREEDFKITFNPVIYEEIMYHLPGAAALYEISDKINTLIINDKALQKTGYKKEEYNERIRENSASIVVLEDLGKLWKEINSSIEEQKLLNTSFRIRRKDGSLLWVAVWANPVGKRGGNPVYLAMFNDATQQKKAAALLEQAQNLRRNLKEDSVLSLEIDLTGNMVICCDCAKIHGFYYNEQENYGNFIRGAAGRIHWEEREEFLASLNREALLKAYYEGERLIKMDYRYLPDHSNQFMYLQLTIYFLPNAVNGHVTMDIVAHDITCQKDKEMELRSKAERDPLTQIFNREAMEQRIKLFLHENRKEPDKKHALFMIDVDNFKAVNDTLGHRTGDRALMEIGRRLKQLFRKSDICGRMGGDEFVVFMTNVEETENVVKKASQICGALQFLTFNDAGEETDVSCSVGVAVSPDSGTTYEVLFEKADCAVYQAKKQGKSQYVLYQK